MVADAKILVAVDFSRASESALLAAVRLARRDGARLVVLHVVDHEVGRSAWARLTRLSPEELEQRVRQEQRERLGQLVEGCGVDPLEVELRVELGWPPRQIAEVGEGLGCERIVVSAGGHTALARLMLGSTTDRLVRLSRVPVQVVRSGPLRRARRVLVGIDLDEASGRVLEFARREARAEGAELFVLHAYHDPGEARPVGGIEEEDWARYRAGVQEQARWAFEGYLEAHGGADGVALLLVSGGAGETLLRHAEAIHADLVVVGYREHPYERFLGWTCEQVMRAAPCDVLVVPPVQAEAS